MSLVTALLKGQAQKVVTQMKGYGAELKDICAVLASIQGESSFNPKAVGDHGHAFGLCQIHADRAALIKAGCGVDLTTLPPLEDQIKGIWFELNHSEKHAWAMTKATATPYAAGYAFCQYYERPARPLIDCPKRGDWALDWFNAFNT